ncbi:MAG: hypothetical protein LQ342_006126 [Letrouitia transgressa]|nr:MAG: hypothetical protein LQ342_006126 [Letrouitia transgressa]
MPTSSPQSRVAPSSKPVKLRQSCDSCLQAKVKCSKDRPLCSRCLSNGAPCGYSPSSRAGRKNRDARISKPANSANQNGKALSFASSDKSFSSSPLDISLHEFPSKRNLVNQDTRSLGIFGDTESLAHRDLGKGQTVTERSTPISQDTKGVEDVDFLPTPPFNDFMDSFVCLSPQAPFAELAPAAMPSPISTQSDINLPSTKSAWSNNFLSCPTLPSFQSSFEQLYSGQPMTSRPDTRSSLSMQNETMPSVPQTQFERIARCDCFASSLQLLSSLHTHSVPSPSNPQGGPPFDMMLITTGTGIGNSVLLLATMFGKILSLYKATCRFHFGTAPGIHETAELAFGAYTVTGEERKLIEIEILLLELRKVEDALKRFDEKICNPLPGKDETGFQGAVILYLKKNLRYIVEFLKARKVGLSSDNHNYIYDISTV